MGIWNRVTAGGELDSVWVCEEKFGRLRDYRLLADERPILC